MKCCEHGPVATRQLRYYDAAAPVIANHYNSSIVFADQTKSFNIKWSLVKAPRWQDTAFLKNY